MLHEADPTGERLDSDELIQLEEQCLKMGPLIDQELEVVDKTHASLSSVNSQLVEALNIYCALMKENAAYSTAMPPQSPYMQPPQQIAVQQPNQYQPNPAINPQYSYAQPIQSPYSPYSSPYASMPNPSSMTPTSAPFNHVYSSPTVNQTSTTYTVPSQVHYGDVNSQQMLQQPTPDPNTSIQQTSTNGQPIPQQIVNNQMNYSQQPATSMVLPNQ